MKGAAAPGATSEGRKSALKRVQIYTKIRSAPLAQIYTKIRSAPGASLARYGPVKNRKQVNIFDTVKFWDMQ